jgi:peptide/nickel transport system permease protein
MTRFIVRRLGESLILLFIISIVVFLLVSNIGDPVETMGGMTGLQPQDYEQLQRKLGLDQPVYLRYVYWLVGNDWTKIDMDGNGVRETPGIRKGILRGDFGTSLTDRGVPVLGLIMNRLPNTLILMIPAQLLIIILGISFGIISALKQYSFIDNALTAFSFLGLSTPVFVISLLLIYIFSGLFRRWGLPYLPSVGMFEFSKGKTVSQVILHLILPVSCIVFLSMAKYVRYARSAMLEVISQDYIRTAKAKGLDIKYIISSHALKNAALPIITLIGMDLPLLLAGATVTEKIFGWPGMGRLFLDHIQNYDTPVVMGIIVFVATAVVIFQIITDLTYAALNPRIRLD